MSKNTITAIVVLLITFGAGMIAGHLLTRQVTVIPGNETEIGPGERQWQGQRQGVRIRTMMADELELSEDQAEEFFDIISEYRQKSARLFNESRKELEKALDEQANELMTELGKILTPGQLEKFDERFSRRAMMERTRLSPKRRGGPGNGSQP
jgi:Spy/CpxP family protein refolding chaperone